MLEDVIDALVVGGGPVGLTMACELARHGVSCRIVDQNAAPQRWSKAAAVMPRTLEVLRDVGVADALIARGKPVYGVNVHQNGTRIAHVAIHLEGTPYPYILGVSQRETELVLAEHLAGHGVRFEREVTLVELTQDDEGVTATLERAGGERETVRARYAIGCDGAHSTVRRALGFAFEGSTFEQALWHADIRIRFPFDVDPNEAQMFVSEHGVMGALPVFGGGRYRLIAMAPPRADLDPTLEDMQALAKERLPEGTVIEDPDWITGFRFHGRLASRYRDRRIFLAGDAGHIHSPAGAQGMNMGIQDAYNLAWKLALVMRGAGQPALLESYEPERRPIAEGVVRGTDRGTRTALRMIALRNPILTKLRGQLVSFITELGVFQSTVMQTVGQVRVGYPDSPIVGEHHSSVWTAELGERRDERPRLSDWMQFADGPGPGRRVPDLELADGTLHDLLQGTAHVLFLFDGSAATAAGYANLDGIAERVQRRYGELVRVHVVVPLAERPAELRAPDVLLDPDGALHACFGCGSEALYLVRPDGYVGFRSQPADEDALSRYLATIFTGWSADQFAAVEKS